MKKFVDLSRLIATGVSCAILMTLVSWLPAAVRLAILAAYAAIALWMSYKTTTRVFRSGDRQ